MTDTAPPQRVFITGALGFIGRALAERWRGQGADVRGVDRVADPEHQILAGDISQPGPWQEQAAGCDLVVHTAAIVSNASSLDRAWRVNVLGTRHALDAAARAGASRFVHLSSVRAFSDLQFPAGVEETWPVRTDGNPYVDTKVAAEQVVLQAHAAGETGVTVVRPGDVYGPGSRPWTVLPVEAIRARQFVLPAWGKGIFSPVYIENLIDGILLAGTTGKAVGQVITISDDCAVSTRSFFAHYYRMLGRRGPPLLPTGAASALARAASVAARLRGMETEANTATVRYLARTGTYSTAKARLLLGYKPNVTLDDGMERTEHWLRRQGLLG